MQPQSASRIDVVRTHLELRALHALRPAPRPTLRFMLRPTLRPTLGPDEPMKIERCAGIAASAYRALYTLIGEPWHWHDRLTWTDPELDAYLAAPTVQVWTLRIGGDTAGYFELQRHADTTVEIMYFGLARPFIGQGLGGWLLTRACEEAFACGGTAVVLNTCTLDAPQALPNYLARGFAIVREERYSVDAATGTGEPGPEPI